MANDQSYMLGAVTIGMMNKAERDRGRNSILMTMMPGPPATRAAIATVAVSSQARDAVRRERRVATATISAIEDIATNKTTAAEAFAHQPLLRDLNPSTLATQYDQAFGPTPTGTVTGSTSTTPAVTPAVTPAAPTAAVTLAAEMVTKALLKTKSKSFTTAEAKKYKDFLDQLPQATRDKIVKNTP